MRIYNTTTLLDFTRNIGLLFWTVYFIIPYREYSSKPLLFFFLLLGLLLLWVWAIGYKDSEETSFISSRFFKMDWKSGLFFTGVLFILLAINFRFLNAPIAWRGDEDFHIYRAFFFLQFIQSKAATVKPLFILLPVLYAAIFLLRLSGRIQISFIDAITIPLVIFSIIWSLFTGGDYKDAFLRYPPLLMVFQSFLVGLWTHSEIAHRMMAFIPFAGIFFLIFKYLEPITGRFNAALSSLIFAVTPLFFYFSTVTSLEQGALLLVALALFLLINANQLNTRDLRIIAGIAGFSGFCKETMIPFLIGIFIVLIIIELRSIPGRKVGQFVLNGFRFSILLFVPILPFLLLNSSPNLNLHHVNWLTLIDLPIYKLFFSGILSQITIPILLICILGIIGGLFIKKCRYTILAAILTSLLSFVGVSTIATPLVGYARFNLTFSPFFFVGFLLFFRPEFIKQYSNKIVFPVFLIILLSISSAFAPITFAQRNNWGSSKVDTSEYYYPYNKALRWIAERNRNIQIIILGHNYPYFVEFYRFKYKIVNEIMQDIGGISPVLAIKKAIERKADILILHNIPQTHVLFPDEIRQYLIKSFELDGNFLDVIRVPTDNKEREDAQLIEQI